MHFSGKHRFLRYCVSAAVTFAMLGIAFAFMCCSLNLQGYVHPESPVRVPFLAHFAEEGNLFDPKRHMVWSLVPVVFHTVMIMILNAKYRTVAEWLTDWENHRTVHEHENVRASGDE